eukprot:8737535-Pyramimonas_sp.AAC.1
MTAEGNIVNICPRGDVFGKYQPVWCHPELAAAPTFSWNDATLARYPRRPGGAAQALSTAGASITPS